MSEQETAVPEEGQTDQEAVQLSLQDIATCVQIIDVCSKRGAFEGGEMETIGGLRNRVAAFLEANKPPAEEEITEDTAAAA